MTKRDELLSLAERCEKADKGSFALECAIAEAVGGLATPPRNYTVSLDAALELVPIGHDWSLFFDNSAALAGCMPASEDGCDMTDVPGSTPALALCAAALRAQAEMES
jgi:hypothetical protein